MSKNGVKILRRMTRDNFDPYKVLEQIRQDDCKDRRYEALRLLEESCHAFIRLQVTYLTLVDDICWIAKGNILMSDLKSECKTLRGAFDQQAHELSLACETMTPEQLIKFRQKAYPSLYNGDSPCSPK